MSDQKPGTGEPDLDKLDREIDAPMLAIYGAGTILGAGIYVLIGKFIFGGGGH